MSLEKKELSKTSAKAPKVIGVLLVYYEKYSGESISRFISFLATVSKNSTLVIVQNKEFQLPEISHPDLHLIEGDNSVREFSGWETAIIFCRQNNLDSGEGVFVFANDTFCHHNKFGPLSRYLFGAKFRFVARHSQSLLLAGEVHTNHTEYAMMEKKFSGWISTYLFCITFDLTRKIGGLLPAELDLDSFFTGQVSAQNFLTGALSENLIKDTNNWVFGLSPAAKWYGSAELTNESFPAFVGKTKSILCEKFLTAKSLSVGGQIISTFSSRWLNQVRRLERLLPK